MRGLDRLAAWAFSASRTVITFFPVICCVVAASTPVSTHAGEGLRLLPRQVEISGSQRWQSVIAQQQDANGQLGKQLQGDQISYRITDPEIASWENGRILPKKDGVTTLVAQWSRQDGAGVSVEVDAIPIKISNFQSDNRWEFTNHVQAVLARAGCNSGPCHGALAGKGGFRLSLRGYDSLADHFTITRQDRGRRVELADPARSLLLTKPSEAVPHKGGLRLPVDGFDYQVLSQWISSGAEGQVDTDPALDHIEVTPSRVRLAPGDQQQILVTAHYNNGRVEDVTHWAKFAATDESVCQVDEHGKVTVIGHGEGAVSAWFASRIVLSRITVPYGAELQDGDLANVISESIVDRYVSKQLKELGLSPSAASTDQEFVRRAYLDTIGALPTTEEVKQYCESSESDKKAKLVESLLNRSEFVDYWTYKWSDLLMINGTLLRPDAVKSYYTWVRKHVEKNTPWDEFVREILTAKGGTLEQGATNFYSLHQDPESMTENACQAFLSLSIGCARCHNHPLEKWTNNQYYAMANLFSRVRAKGWGGDSRNGDGKRTLLVLERGELIQPSLGKPQLPAPLDGDPIDPSSPVDRREYLASWMTSPDNPYFTKAIVNRVWANFFGVGLVQPIDDLRISNPASNPELFDALAEYVREKKFNLKDLMREILLSKTYALSSVVNESNKNDKRFFSHYYPKRLMAEVLHDAVCQATAVPTTFNEIEFPGADSAKTDFYPAGTKAIQLYDSAVMNYFLKSFGRNQRRITCECERSDESSVVQVLHLSNGKTVNEKLASDKGIVAQWMSGTWAPADIVEQAYWRSVSRPPTVEERNRLVSELEAIPAEERRTALEDLLWSLLSSREFIFNH
jgi:hypothetical protein